MFAIYQWGVETDENLIYSPLFSCSQFTNEELKLFQSCLATLFIIVVRNLPMRSWNKFKTEPLSFLKPVRNLPMRSWNLNFFFCVDLNVSVRNLPMRSWNSVCSQVAYAGCKLFAIYQWGVETSTIISSLLIVICMFTIYQWGVETRETSTASLRFTGVVRNLPMRSWNENFIHFNRGFTFVRNLPMRSWNRFKLFIL